MLNSGSQPSEELQALLDAALDAVVVIDHRGGIEVFNQSAKRLFGYTEEEILGRNVSILMTEPDRVSHDAYLARYAATGIPHIIGIGRHIEAQRKDGSIFPAHLSVGRIAAAEPPRFVGFIRDVTLRRQALAAVERERDRANLYLAVSQTILLALDAERRVKMINRKGCEVLSVLEGELLGCDWLDAAVPAAGHESVRAELAAALGQPEGETHNCEYYVCGPAGEPRLISWRCVRVPDLQGSLSGLLCAGDDITERRRAEAEGRRSQERMTHVSRLATMGEMAAGIAHELNQPLAAVANYAQACDRLLGTDEPDLVEIRDALRQIASQALRAGEIIRRLRRLVRKQDTARTPTDINELIDELRLLTQPDAHLHDVRLRFELAATLPLVSIDRIQMQQVLLNLVRNALEALTDGRRDGREIVIHTSHLPDGDVEACVCDNGPGVSPDIVDRMFDPFCTTKDAGTGLGLAISRTIVRAHNGTLGHRPNSPIGACFFVRLPLIRNGDP